MKKQPAKSGLEAKASALTPPNAIRLDEIVEEIVDHLRPWKDRKGHEGDQNCSESGPEVFAHIGSSGGQAF
jgi:hypothetical protein